MTLGLVVLAPVLVIATLLVLGPMNDGASSSSLRVILLADFVYALVVAALVLARVMRMIADRRRQSAGSALHLRLTGVFALVALIPTVLVAVFAVLTVNVGLEGWFSDRVQRVVGASMAAAEAYEREHREALVQDAEALAAYINVTKQSTFFLEDDQLRPVLTDAQERVQRGLREAFLIDGGGELRTRGDKSYLFDFEKPAPDEIARAQKGEVVVIQDWDNNEFRALVHLDAFADRYLYISREVDGNLLSLLDETKETVRFYQQVEKARGRILFEFGLLYLGFALILILAAIWLGLWFAERLSRPVGRLASAAARVGEGDLNVQVIEEEGDDEIATLGRVFNTMTRELKGQRDALMESHRQSERRRRLFDSVLSSVTAGVIGLDAEGDVDFVNRAAERLLDFRDGQSDMALAVAVPEFAALFDRLRQGGGAAVQEEIRLTRNGRMESLLVRMAVRRNDSGKLEGFVVAFDDVTELVSAQRMAAWGDVARRIAHEIKNPLTPIQLSAERLEMKLSGKVQPPEQAVLVKSVKTIVDQVDAMKRLVNEFRDYARLPAADLKPVDLNALLVDVLQLYNAESLPIVLRSELDERCPPIRGDAQQIRQVIHNLLQNAQDAAEAAASGTGKRGEVVIRTRLGDSGRRVRLTVQDSGPGFAENILKRAFEPYVTTKTKGTGLGLAVVKKIADEHGARIELSNRVVDGAVAGAQVSLSFALASEPRAAVAHTEDSKSSAA